MANIIDREEVFRQDLNYAANAGERKAAASEHRRAVWKVMGLATREVCKRMAESGWLSDLIADCNSKYSSQDGSGFDRQVYFPFGGAKKGVYYRDASAFYQTSTYQSWQTGLPLPEFIVANAALGVVRYRDPNQSYELPVLVDVGRGLLSAEHGGKRLVGFLKDIPPGLLVSSLTKGDVLPDIEADAMSAREGDVFVYQHLRHERDPKIIAAKRRQVLGVTGRLACSVCSFDFRRFYGEVGAEFCEVHHLKGAS